MRPALVIIDMQQWFFRSKERRVKLPELIQSINELIDVYLARYGEINYINTNLINQENKDKAIKEIMQTIGVKDNL